MISIIVAVYNIEEEVKYCIESILKQSHPDWELILVNDGSKDNSKAVCEKYAQVDSRIKVISKSNGGLSSARNAGLSNATGQWVMFVDGDDYIKADTIKVLTRLTEELNDSVSCIQYGYTEVNDYLLTDGIINEDYKLEVVNDPQIMFDRLLSIGGEAASACTKLLRRDLMNQFKFKEGIINEDEEFTSRLLLGIDGMAYCNIKPYMYVRRVNSITTSRFSKKRLDLISIMQERINLLHSRGFNDTAQKFRVKMIDSLNIMFLAARAADDINSCDIIKKEMINQLCLINYSTVPWSRAIRNKYRGIARKLPILEFEARLRKLLHKEVRYE